MLRVGILAARYGMRAWSSLTPRERAELWSLALTARERRFRLTEKERRRAFELGRRAARGGTGRRR